MRGIFYATPIEPQSVYVPGDIIKFHFSNMRDYINIEGSQLQANITINWTGPQHATSADQHDKGGYVCLSLPHIFRKMRLVNGQTEIEKIEYYGKFNAREFFNKCTSHGEYTAHGLYSSMHYRDATDTILTKDTTRTVDLLSDTTSMYTIYSYYADTVAEPAEQHDHIKCIIPIRTLMEESGYFPTGKLIKGLEYQFEIDDLKNFTWTGNFGENTTDSSISSVQITSIEWVMDSIKYSLGGMPSFDSYTFHSFGTTGVKENVMEGGSRKYIMDWGYSSLKRALSWLDIKDKTTVTKVVEYQSLCINEIPFSQGSYPSSKDLSYEYWWNLGSRRYPHEDIVNDMRKGYYQHLKAIHGQDISGDFGDNCASIPRDIDGAGENDTAHAASIFMDAVFDVLDQSGSLISGVDVSTVKAPIMVVGDEPTVLHQSVFHTSEVVDLERYIFENHDVFGIVEGGKFVIQD